MSIENAPVVAGEPLQITVTRYGVEISSAQCRDFILRPLRPTLIVDGQELSAGQPTAKQGEAGGIELHWEFDTSTVRLRQHFLTNESGALSLQTELTNAGEAEIALNNVQLLSGAADEAFHYTVGTGTDLVFYEQGNLSAQVRRCGSSGATVGVAEDPTQRVTANGDSQACWLGYSAANRFAWLAGFTTADRWEGHIQTQETEAGTVRNWQIGFDGGDVIIDAGQTVALESVVFLAGSEPYTLLETYGDLVAARHRHTVLPKSPVSWCSWYPFRLSVTEDRVLANARVAAQRLKAIGMEIIEVDLGWEKEYLPSSFEENAQFPHGLGALSGDLQNLGFKLGVWRSLFTISARDEMAQQHPEWLLGDAQHQPKPLGEWFWIPHGETYALDLTHPGAQEWLRQKVGSLFDRGAYYLKADFAGCISRPDLRGRHDRRIVAGGGYEAGRIGMRIIKEEAEKRVETPLLLNMALPEIPGDGSFNIFYTCHDTGNTGYTAFEFLRNDYGKHLAGHLWKQGRWGIIQPSCLCVGLPGTLEEARLRATATFLCGGQVDISDDLTALPEDRWQVLTATLPPQGKAAHPVDLFEPIQCTSVSYEAMCRGLMDTGQTLAASDLYSRAWHLPVEGGWDQWHLVGLFNYDRPQSDVTAGAELITCFHLPLEKLGLETDKSYWAFEFWSGQFLGSLPPQPQHAQLAPHDYTHPGDARTLIAMREAGKLEVAFFGPAVKLLVLREARNHPWVVGTGFYQGSGLELQNVVWEPSAGGGTLPANGGTLRGELHRPAGQYGDVFIANAAQPPSRVTVDGQPATWHHSANGAIALGILTREPVTHWEVHWD